MESDKPWRVTLVVLFFQFVTPSSLSAGAPTELVRTTVDQVLMILQDPRLKSGESRGERISQLRQAIYAGFDFTEMAKRSLGSHWRQRTPGEQQEFVKIFSEFLEKLYVDRIESHKGEKIAYTRELQDKDYAQVDTKIVTREAEEFSIQYNLHAANGTWKIHDVVIDNVSLINNYRSQFNRILTTASFDDLLKRLHEKGRNETGADTSRFDRSIALFVFFGQRRF
jgi:phospholipid transport system substrate-binding protein